MFYILNKREAVKVKSIEIWIQQFELKNRVVEKTTIGDIEISTVFLGIDHSFEDGQPLIFETMISGLPNEEYCRRYSTWIEAERGHYLARLYILKGEYYE